MSPLLAAATSTLSPSAASNLSHTSCILSKAPITMPLPTLPDPNAFAPGWPPVTAPDFYHWLTTAPPGATLIYHTGPFLPRGKGAHTLAWHAYKENLVILYQRRLNDHFQYIAERRDVSASAPHKPRKPIAN